MSNIIDKIQLSGVTYDIGGQGGSGVSVVEVTQVEYDALPSSAKTDTSKMYVITDAEAGDLTNYYTKSETNTLLGGKQATLVSGTNIKTINNESLLGSGNIDIQGGGGSITIDPTLDSGSTNAVANSAITTAIDSKQNVLNTGYYGGVSSTYMSSGEDVWDYAILKKFVNSGNTVAQNGEDRVYFTRINGKQLISAWNPTLIPLPNLSLVETSAITTSISSSSTDAQVPSAKAVYDIVGNIETLLSQI